MQAKFRLLPRRRPSKAPCILDFETTLIGSGSFGKVYRSVHRQSLQVFAIKEISKLDSLSRRKQAYELQQVNHQLFIMYQLESEFIVKTYDHFEDQEHIYLLMEYVEGMELYRGFIQKGKRLSNTQIAKIVFQLCIALRHLHQKKIIHRDIKPENIILTKSMDIKLIDFGTSNFIGPNEIRMTRTGSLPYFAPEIVMKSEHGEAVDLWCVGILLYEMFVLKTPFEDPKNTAENILKNRILYPSIMDPEMKDLIQRILVKDPSKRLRIEDIIKHPWIVKNLQSRPPLSARTKARSAEKKSLTKQETQKMVGSKSSKSLSKKAKTVEEKEFLSEKMSKLQKEIKNLPHQHNLEEQKKVKVMEKKLAQVQDRVEKTKQESGKYESIIRLNQKKSQELRVEIKALNKIRRENESLQSLITLRKQEFVSQTENKTKLKLAHNILESQIKLLRNPNSHSRSRSKDSKVLSQSKPALSTLSINLESPLAKYMTSKSQKFPTQESAKYSTITDIESYISSLTMKQNFVSQ